MTISKARPKKLMIVDDDKVVLSILQKFFEKNGFEVISFDTSPRAWGFLRSQFTVDLMIVDLVMPVVTGIYIIEEGRKKNIPYIMISSGIGLEMGEDLESFGLSRKEVFPKPIDLYKLLDTVKAKLNIS